jgi:outer membrane protein assembly factor BamB
VSTERSSRYRREAATLKASHHAPAPAGSLFLTQPRHGFVTVKLTKLANITFGGGIPIPDPMAKAYGWATAIDPATGRTRWHAKMATPMIAAITPTAGGLVFTGDLNGNLLALDATSGKMLYRYNTKNAMAGGIITYRAEATQYVAATAGNTSFVAWKVTGKPTLFVFAL